MGLKLLKHRNHLPLDLRSLSARSPPGSNGSRDLKTKEGRCHNELECLARRFVSRNHYQTRYLTAVKPQVHVKLHIYGYGQ